MVYRNAGKEPKTVAEFYNVGRGIMAQKILVVESFHDDVCSQIIEGKIIDPDLVSNETRYLSLGETQAVFVWGTSTEDNGKYVTVLKALADGWKLLGSPRKITYKEGSVKYTRYQWWLAKD